MANTTAETFTMGQTYKTELCKFLPNYHSTPHPTTEMPHVEIMFGCKIKTKMSQFSMTRNDRYIHKKRQQFKDEKQTVS